MSTTIIPFPTELRPRLPTIVGNVDYLTVQQRLVEIDSLLLHSGIEDQFINASLQAWVQKAKRPPSARQQQKFQARSRRALRCNLLRTLLQEEYRPFSCQLAGNPLYQWFCGIDALDAVHVPSKSELQRFAHWLSADSMREIHNELLRRSLQQPRALGLTRRLDLDEYFLDTTCLKANIHFPVDWLLLRDGVRTLMKATILVRGQGLKCRMAPPEEFLRRINRQCLEMTHQRRAGGGRKGRKRVLRGMKRLVKTVRSHARRHRELLDKDWERTGWTRPQAEQVIGRIDSVLALLPRAQKQAHERIIGGRLVQNAEKILSLYDTDVRVIVRGKAGAEVEFGNTVLLGENRQGIILDYALFAEQVPSDTNLVVESLRRERDALGKPVGALGTDRGFFSAANRQGLRQAGIYDAMCPRKPEELKKRMKEGKFARMQRRRSQTEGRIGIMKRGFLGSPMRAKGFENRELALAWGVLTHNLWMFARMRKKKKPPLLKAA